VKGKINLLIFLNSLVVGGVERHVIDLIRRIDHEKYHIYLVIPPGLMKILKNELSRLEVDVVELEIRSWLQVKEIVRLIKVLRKNRIDIVHSHDYYASRFGSPIAKLCGVPLVVQTAHMEELWRSGWKKLLVYIDSLSSLFADKVIAVSNAVKQFLVNSKKIQSSKIQVVHNGIDFDNFGHINIGRECQLMKNRFNIKPEHQIILVVGRLVPQKGHTYLIDSAPRIISQYADCKFFFAGEGELQDSLMAKIKHLDIEDHFIFAGYIENISAVYKMADLVVLPSLYEGLPYVAIEASYLSRPIVATAVSGTPDVVLNNITGLTVPPGDSEALGEAILRLLKDSDYANELAGNAHKFVTEKFSIERQIKETQAIYEKCLKRKRNSQT